MHVASTSVPVISALVLQEYSNWKRAYPLKSLNNKSAYFIRSVLSPRETWTEWKTLPGMVFACNAIASNCGTHALLQNMTRSKELNPN